MNVGIKPSVVLNPRVPTVRAAMCYRCTNLKLHAAILVEAVSTRDGSYSTVNRSSQRIRVPVTRVRLVLSQSLRRNVTYLVLNLLNDLDSAALYVRLRIRTLKALVTTTSSWWLTVERSLGTAIDVFSVRALTVVSLVLNVLVLY